jgi:polar amino acid transport system substrate-binding protein
MAVILPAGLRGLPTCRGLLGLLGLLDPLIPLSPLGLSAPERGAMQRRHKACVVPPLALCETGRHSGAAASQTSFTRGDRSMTPRRFLNTLGLCALAPALLLAASAAQAQTALDSILAKKLILIAVPTDSPPYGFVGTDLQPRGFDVDTANLIGAKLGVKTELVPVTSANRIPYLQTKKADLVISTLGKNAEREKVIDFTIAYSPFFQAVFGPKSIPVKSYADLAGKSVGVTRGAMEDQELAKVAPASLEVRRFEDMNGTVAAYVSGQVQFIAVGASVAGDMMGKNPQLGTEFKLLLKDSPNYIGVAKGEDKLRLKVNEIIADAKKSGELNAMALKWLGRPLGELP